MSEATKIEWCDSTFNPWIGCTKISPACDHCYAEAQMDTRMGRVEWGAGKPRSRTSEAYWKQPLRWNAQPFWQCTKCGLRGDSNWALDGRMCSGERHCRDCYSVVDIARRRVFCASLADVFDNDVPVEWLADLLLLIYSTPNIDWLLLTKRIGNVRARLLQCIELLPTVHKAWLIGRSDGIPLANVWLGATVVNQQEADRDIPKLLAVPAAKRFLSIEPMLGPIDLSIDGLWNTECGRCEYGHQCPETGAWECSACDGTQKSGEVGIDWIICGGESGPHARPMHPDWVRSLRDQCRDAGVPFLFKQWGEWGPTEPCSDGRGTQVSPGMQRLGKKATGRLLDGREHSEWPTA